MSMHALVHFACKSLSDERNAFGSSRMKGAKLYVYLFKNMPVKLYVYLPKDVPVTLCKSCLMQASSKVDKAVQQSVLVAVHRIPSATKER